MLFDTYRARAWTATTVRGCERLVQVQMNHIEPHIAGT